MNILHVVDMISQSVAGGSAKVPFHLAKEQAKLGHAVTIFASDYQANSQQAPDGVKLVKFKTVANPWGKIRITPSMIFANLRKFDIAHLHNYRTFVNLVAANSDVPYVVQAHGSCRPVGKWSGLVRRSIWGNLIFRHASRFIADAPMETSLYAKEGVDEHKVVTIPVGIDLAEFAHLPKREEKHGKVVLYLGRLHYLKGADLLVRAFASLNRPDTKLVIIGVDYGLETTLRKLVTELGIVDYRVLFLNPMTIDKPWWYVNADVYVMPSRYEMWGIAFMEALACGCPVIMTDRCGAAYLLPPECGLVVGCNVARLAEAISSMLDNDFANQYRTYRQAWVKQFSWDKIAKRTIELYKEVLIEKCHL